MTGFNRPRIMSRRLKPAAAENCIICRDGTRWEYLSTYTNIRLQFTYCDLQNFDPSHKDYILKLNNKTSLILRVRVRMLNPRTLDPEPQQRRTNQWQASPVMNCINWAVITSAWRTKWLLAVQSNASQWQLIYEEWINDTETLINTLVKNI